VIIYIADPLELLEKKDQGRTIRVRLPSGGYLTVESVDFEQWRVVDICSTDPMDYMSKTYYPGSLIDQKELK